MSSAPRLIPAFSPLGRMVAWEEGQLDRTQTVELFQHLVDNGWAWILQGIYGRMANSLIQEGLVIA